MTIRHLQLFQVVCTTKSITLAAEQLNITQPAVSIAMKELESFYHTKLFDRIGRKLYLTEAGELLRQYADTILKQYEEAAVLLRDGKSLLQCHMGVNVSASESYLKEMLASLQEAFPTLKLSVVVQDNEQLEKLLKENQLDFAIYDDIQKQDTKETILLFADDMVAVCAPSFFPSDSIDISEFAKQPLLLREKGSGLRNCVNAELLRHGYSPQIIAESISTMSLVELAESSMGFTVLPVQLADKVCIGERLKCVQVHGADFQRYYYLTYYKNKHLTPTVQAVIEKLRTLFHTSFSC